MISFRLNSDATKRIRPNTKSLTAFYAPPNTVSHHASIQSLQRVDALLNRVNADFNVWGCLSAEVVDIHDSTCHYDMQTRATHLADVIISHCSCCPLFKVTRGLGVSSWRYSILLSTRPKCTLDRSIWRQPFCKAWARGKVRRIRLNQGRNHSACLAIARPKQMIYRHILYSLPLDNFL